MTINSFNTTFLAFIFTTCVLYNSQNFLPGDVTESRRTDPPSLFTFTGVTNLVSSVSSNIGENKPKR